MKTFYILTIIAIIFIINSISAVIPEDIGIDDKPLPLPLNEEIEDKPLPLPLNDENEGIEDKPLPLPLNDENKGIIEKPLPVPLDNENEGIIDKPLPLPINNENELPVPLNDENEETIDRPILPLPLNDDNEGMIDEPFSIPIHDENEEIIDEPLPLPEEPIGKPLLLPLHEGPHDKPTPPHEDFKESFYLIHIKDTSGDSSRRKKRQEISYNVEAAIYEIHNLIVNNMNTYENITILEEMEEMDKRLRKRNIEEYSKKYGESSYIYPIANTDQRTVAFAYLSKNVLEEVVTISDVVYVEERMVYHSEASSYYDVKDIKNYTNWKNVAVTNDASLHLSLISQGKYSSNFIGKYDTNYYYPYSGGKGVDVFIFDNGFNFNHPNFSNTSERTVRCLLRVNKGKVTKISGKSCLNENSNNHGTKIATVVGGLYDGVATKANIYGIEMTEYASENIDAALEYIRDHYFNANKSIFNFSFGAFYDTQGSQEYKAEQILINELTSKGAVFVSSAGNNNSPVNSNNSIHLPSQLNNVISVGGIASKDVNDINSKFKKAQNSNYGEGVDIFAPYTVRLSYTDKNNKSVEKTDSSGTSFSAPIISGVSALIMGENSNMSFNTETIIDYLNDIGQKDVISNLPKYTKNLFVNNGKHIVYSMNNAYYGCGITSGLSVCGSNCCSSNGYCYKSSSSYCTASKGCQSSFGYCKN